MKSIGSRKVADEAAGLYDSMDIRKDSNGTFEHFSGGGFRDVMLHQSSDVIYKVQHDPDKDCSYGNLVEWRAARRLAASGGSDGMIASHLRIPRTSCYNFDDYSVLAMERVSGEHLDEISSEACEGRVQLFLLGKFEDMHEHNYVVERRGGKKIVVPVDMGSPRRIPDPRVLSGLSVRAINRASPKMKRYYKDFFVDNGRVACW